jgi:hypothetical protein
MINMVEYDRETLALALTILVRNVPGFKATQDQYLFTIEPHADHVSPLGVPVGNNPMAGMSFNEMLEMSIGTIAESLSLAPTYVDDKLPLCYAPMELLESETVAH